MGPAIRRRSWRNSAGKRAWSFSRGPGYSCWSREDPGCGFVIWKAKAGKNLPAAVAKELIARGRTEKPVTGFKGRSGRSFRARLALQQAEDGKWRVEFDEPWAREGARAPEGDADEAPGAEAA